MGYSDPKGDLNNPSEQQKAAEDLVKMHLIAFAEGLKQLHWLPIQEQFSEEGNNAKLKGLFAKNGQIRPAGRAWKFLNSIFDQAYKVIKSDRADGTHIFIIEKGSQKIFVAWSDKPATLASTYLGKDNFQVRNLFGEIIQDSAATIKLDSEPKYLF